MFSCMCAAQAMDSGTVVFGGGGAFNCEMAVTVEELMRVSQAEVVDLARRTVPGSAVISGLFTEVLPSYNPFYNPSYSNRPTALSV